MTRTSISLICPLAYCLGETKEPLPVKLYFPSIIAFHTSLAFIVSSIGFAIAGSPSLPAFTSAGPPLPDVACMVLPVI